MARVVKCICSMVSQVSIAVSLHRSFTSHSPCHQGRMYQTAAARFCWSNVLLLLCCLLVPITHCSFERFSPPTVLHSGLEAGSSSRSEHPTQAARAAKTSHPFHITHRRLSAATITNEADLAQAIRAATGPGLTILALPASLILTKSLPDVVGPLQLINASSSAVITCISAFTALSVSTQDFSMAGLTWKGCSSVLKVSGSINVAIQSCLFQQNSLTGATVVRKFEGRLS